MTIMFLGDLKRLNKCVSKTGVKGQWRKIENHQVQFRTDDGAILNWWESTGTITFQGRKLAVEKLKSPFMRAARRKDLLKGKRDTDEEIADMRRQLEGALVEIADLKEVYELVRSGDGQNYSPQAGPSFAAPLDPKSRISTL
jgi:hypothetical protein